MKQTKLLVILVIFIDIKLEKDFAIKLNLESYDFLLKGLIT